MVKTAKRTREQGLTCNQCDMISFMIQNEPEKLKKTKRYFHAMNDKAALKDIEKLEEMHS